MTQKPIERFDCTMCSHWTMMHCELGDSHYPHEGHLCPRRTGP